MTVTGGGVVCWTVTCGGVVGWWVTGGRVGWFLWMRGIWNPQLLVLRSTDPAAMAAPTPQAPIKRPHSQLNPQATGSKNAILFSFSFLE